MLENHDEDYIHKLTNYGLVELIDENGNSIFISPIHSKYRELKQLSDMRREELSE